MALALCVLLSGVGAVTSALAAGESASNTARPVSPAVAYELPAMPMAQALETIARDFKVSVDFTEVKLTGMRSLPVLGLHTANSAAAAALAGSGLVVTSSASGLLKVQTRSSAPQVITIIGAKRDQAETGFKTDYSSTTARNGVSLQETPAGITVVSAKVIETQQSASVLDVLTNVSSVAVQNGGSLSIRGMGNAGLLTNGIVSTADSRVSVTSLPDVAAIERIEVLKGPQSILAGSGILGGAVNFVKKKPQEDPLHTVSLQREARDAMTLAADLSGAVQSDDKRLTYRVIASNKTESTSAMGFDGAKSSFLAPSLRWKDGETDVTIALTNQRQHQAPSNWTSSVNGVIQPIPSRRPGNRSDGIELTTDKLTMDLEHKLPFNMMLISRLERESTRNQLHFYTPLVNLQPESETIAFMGQNTDENYSAISGDHYIRAIIETGPIEHKIAFGFSHVKSKRNATAYVAEGFLPVTLADPAATFTVFNSAIDTRDSLENSQTGVYVQDMMRWGATSVLVGVRNTKHEQGDSVIEPAFGSKRITPAISYDTNNGTLGVVHSITDKVSVYGMVAKGFQPQFSTIWCGPTLGSPRETALKPMETTNKEVGAKFDLLNGKLALTAGYFDLTQTGRPVTVSNRSCLDMQDGQRNKGLDLDLQGEPIPGLSVIANFTKSELTDMVNATRKFDGQPKHQGSVWMVYQLPWAQVQGLGVGLGISAHGESTAGASYSPQPVVIPAWTRTDASLFYSKGRWNGTLGVKNLNGKPIYGYAVSPAYIPVLSTGRDVRFTLAYRFD
jgi:iron complex outermembrane receptor protein